MLSPHSSSSHNSPSPPHGLCSSPPMSRASPRSHQMSPRSTHCSPMPVTNNAVFIATTGETPLNLTKPRPTMSYFGELSDHQKVDVKTELGNDGMLTVQPPPAHSNHTRSLLNPLPHPDIHTSLKAVPFTSPLQFVSNPYVGLHAHSPSSLAGITMPSLAVHANSISPNHCGSPDLIPSVFDKVFHLQHFCFLLVLAFLLLA